MPVEEMNLYRRPCLHPLQTPLDVAVPQSPGGQEGYPVGMWLPVRGRGFSMPSNTRFIPMLSLQMDRQQPERHILSTLRALHPKPLPLPVGIPTPIIRLPYAAPTTFPPPRTSGRTLRQYYQCCSSGPPCWTALPGCWILPGAISVPMTQPWRHTRRRGDFGFFPLVCARYARPLYPPSLHPQNVMQLSAQKSKYVCPSMSRLCWYLIDASTYLFKLQLLPADCGRVLGPILHAQ